MRWYVVSEYHRRRNYPELNDKKKFLQLIFSEGCFTVDKIARRLGVSRQMVKTAMREFEISTDDLMKARLVQTKMVHTGSKRRGRIRD